MEPKFAKDENFEEKLATLLREGGTLKIEQANPQELNYVFMKLLKG